MRLPSWMKVKRLKHNLMTTSFEPLSVKLSKRQRFCSGLGIGLIVKAIASAQPKISAKVVTLNKGYPPKTKGVP